MDEKETKYEEIETAEAAVIDDGSNADVTQTDEKDNKGVGIALTVVAIIFVIIIAGSIILAKQNPQTVGTVRDIFVILMALMLVVIGVALVIIILQISNLINILKNDIKPILDSGTDTINTLKGTVRFLSNNLSEPVIKLNESLASLRRVGQLFKIFKN